MRLAVSLTHTARISPVIQSCCALLVLCTAVLATAHAEIMIDGRADEPEWDQAQRCPAWKRTAPFGRDEPRYGNDVAFLSTEQGLAAIIAIEQPPAERRIKPRTPRDAEAFTGDSVSL
ncbi:MAG TPA: hypothetical protein VHK24_02830, partial [Steroidobacter sp.]|nr:hypothetical protein [Steroidobacter sp.]